MAISSLLRVGLNDSQDKLFVDVSIVDRHSILLLPSLLHHLAKLRAKLRVIDIDRFEVIYSGCLIQHSRLIVDLKCCPLTWSPLVRSIVHLTLARLMIQGDSNVRVEGLTHCH